MKNELKTVEQPKLLKLDLGCGKNKKPGFVGVDCREFEGVDQVVNLAEVRSKSFAAASKDRETDPYAFFNWYQSGEWKYDDTEYTPWPWGSSSVEEAHCSHFVEHLKPDERIHFANELHRVLIPGGKCQLIVPHWASARAYGDMTHQWPPVCEFWFYYLSKDWRAVNAPHNDGYTCDFDATWGYTLHPSVQNRNQEYQMHAIGFWKEAAQDIIATLTKK